MSFVPSSLLRILWRSWLPLSMVVATVLLLLSFGWLRYGPTLGYGSEALLFQATAVVQIALREMQADDTASRHNEASSFLFVDTAYDPTTIDAFGPEGYPLGQQVITDRAKLAELFRVLAATNVHRFVLCDVAFVDPSPDDDALQRALRDTRDVVVSYSLGPDGTPPPPLFDAPRALAEYSPDGDTLVRFPLVHADSIVTVPLHMHRALHPDEPVLGPMHLERFVPDMRILPQTMKKSIPLGSLLTLVADPARAREYFKDYIVVIGNFAGGDKHETLVGPLPGPLILTNVYLALRHDDHAVNPGLLAFLWVALVALAWHVLRFELGPLQAVKRRSGTPPHAERSEQHPEAEADPEVAAESPPDAYWWTRAGARLRKVGADGGRNTVFLTLISVAAYFAFGLHLPVLLLGTGLTLFVEALRYRRSRRSQPEPGA